MRLRPSLSKRRDQGGGRQLDRRDGPFGERGKFDGRQSHKYRDSIDEVCSCLSVGIRLVCLRFCPRCVGCEQTCRRKRHRLPIQLIDNTPTRPPLASPAPTEENIYILIEQVQLPRSGPATSGNFREATSLPPISIFLPLQIYYSL